MIIKAFEVRDTATFIPVVAIKMVPGIEKDSDVQGWHEAERYLLRRAGYGFDDPCILFCRMEATGTSRNATYDCYAWGDTTMHVAHRYLEDHFDELQSGDVIDVQHILKGTPKKISERLEQQQQQPNEDKTK